jgi:hypothetical protein
LEEGGSLFPPSLFVRFSLIFRFDLEHFSLLVPLSIAPIVTLPCHLHHATGLHCISIAVFVHATGSLHISLLRWLLYIYIYIYIYILVFHFLALFNFTFHRNGRCQNNQSTTLFLFYYFFFNKKDILFTMGGSSLV